MLLKLEELLFTQQEVDAEGIDLYKNKLSNNEPIDPIHVRYCHHSDKYLVTDGHHKSYAMFFDCGINEITDDFSDTSRPKFHLYSCSKSLMKKPRDDHCLIKDEFNNILYSINDLKIVAYSAIDEEEYKE